MHDVTKVLVIFVAVLSLLLSALTMALASNVDRVKGAFNDERGLKLAAQADAKSAQSQFREQTAKLEMDKESLNALVAQLNQQIATLTNERSGLRADKEKAIAEVASIRNQIQQLAATTDTQAALIKGYREDISTLRKDQFRAAQVEIQLNDRINDLTSNREVLEQTARALREQLAEAQLAIQTAANQGTGTTAKGQAFESAGPLIRAQVSEVLKTESGDELAVINVGANSGVKENMKLNITRGGDTFVAFIVITKADPQQAIGRINKLGRTVDVRAGDTVLSRLE